MPIEKKSVSDPLVFPTAEVKERLQNEVQKIACQSAILRPEWEPLLDSKRVVGTILVLRDLFPFEIPPDKVVRKGGYKSVEDAINDILERIKNFWFTQIKKGRK